MVDGWAVAATLLEGENKESLGVVIKRICISTSSKECEISTLVQLEEAIRRAVCAARAVDESTHMSEWL